MKSETAEPNPIWLFIGGLDSHASMAASGIEPGSVGLVVAQPLLVIINKHI